MAEPTHSQPSLAETAYPDALREAEDALRLGKPGRTGSTPRVGFGLSGGGIRSATFCLGAFQALAKRDLLGRIDYLSTVSGGGYFGSFLGRLFLRQQDGGGALDATDVAAHLDPDSTRPAKGMPRGAVLRWLRENGRYLAPKGAGDLLLGGAVIVRNLLAVHAVIFVGLLSLWLIVQGLRELGTFGAARINALAFLPGAVPAAGDLLVWWSPLIVLPAIVLVVAVVPPASGYWILLYIMAGADPGEKPVWKQGRFLGWVAFILLLGVAASVVLNVAARTRMSEVTAIALAVLMLIFACALTYAVIAYVLGGTRFLWSRLRSRKSTASEGSHDTGAGTRETRESFQDNYARHWISDRLRTGMLVMAILLAVALIDSMGQSLYLLVRRGVLDWPWIASALGSLVALGAGARRMFVTFGGALGGKRLSIPKGVLALAAALLLALTLLTLVNTLSHAVVWGLQNPQPGDVTPALRIDDRTWFPAIVVLGLAVSLATFFGRQWHFTNASTFQPLYGARLVRAYLGASNPRRHRGDLPATATAVTEVISGDDISQNGYWPWDADKTSASGTGRNHRWVHAPLHIVNVTVNETCDGRSQVQQQDRKGTGMAIGPCGLSLGVRHHLLCRPGQPPAAFPEMGYKVFDPAAFSGKEGGYPGEALSLGRWAGISGAAFSTGLGSRTNLGLSLLLGLANVRLGYWWNSGIDPDKRPDAGRRGRRALTGIAENLLRRSLPVYAGLLDEFLARFHGTAHQHWYLSDGGHFENLGGYELIRRRLEHIVLIDAEADPDYTFDGLAGLVRKARIDFGAEIRFLESHELDTLLTPEVRPYVGTLPALKRGRWSLEPFAEPGATDGERPRQVLDPPDRRFYSRAHAALAEVYYDGAAEPGSRLLYVKATLTGDEPADLVEYHGDHPDFPHESTADQFFGEAQWESYRRLGEHIMGRLIPGGAQDAAETDNGKQSLAYMLGL